MNLHYHIVPERPGTAFALRCICFVTVFVCMLTTTARSNDVPQIEAEAPPNCAVLKHTRGGAFFVAKPLKQEYDRLLSQVESLQADLAAERISGADAQLELQTLQAELTRLREDIERKKILVEPVKVHRQSETTTFELGPARLLVITADNIRVEGWNGSRVKCVLDKTVLAPDGKPVDGHLRDMKLIHRHGQATSLVGNTPAERDAREQKFLASPDGQSLNEQQREARRQLLQRITAGYEAYGAFQGKEIDTLEIEGLTDEQGNRQISVTVDSSGGGRSSGSHWQRHAALTVYVPSCEAVALRGCLVNLDVQGVQAALVVTRDGSRDRDYDGHFQVRDLYGSLVVDNAPLDLVDGIHGNVSIRSTVELANTGTRHRSGKRTFYIQPPRVLTCRNIDGDLTALFTRAALELKAIGGGIDIRNEFGDTTLAVGPGLAEKPHRVVSESGQIEVNLAPEALDRLPLQALTSCGTIRTNVGQDVLPDVSFTVGRDYTGTSRNWRGVISNSGGADRFHVATMEAIDRLDAALQGHERPAGLDLVSRCGTIRVLCGP